HGHRVVRGRRGGRDGQPARRGGGRDHDGAGGGHHHLLRAQARRDHGLRRDGAGPPRPAQRFLRRGRAHGVRVPGAAAVARWLGRHPVGAFAVFFAVFPFLVPYKALASQVLIFGLFALGFNLLYGYTGLLSFGHAAYYGLGAYGTGIAPSTSPCSRWPSPSSCTSSPSTWPTSRAATMDCAAFRSCR